MRIQSEAEEKKILEKLVVISEEFLQSDSTELNYQKITDNILDISGAKYAGFNLYDEEGSKSITVAFSAPEGIIKKVSSLLGFKLVGKKWNHDPVRTEKIKSHAITHFSTLSEIAGDLIAIPVASLLGKTFNFGEVVIAKILKGNVMIGDFTLIMPRNVKFKNDNYVEIYIRQVGLLITRSKAIEEIKSLAKFPEENPNIVGRIDYYGKLLYCNHAYKKIFAGKDHIPLKLKDAVKKIAAEKSYKQEYVEIKIDNRIFLFNLIPIKKENYINFYGRDITEHMRAEQDLKRSNIDLERFAYVASHDLQEPLRMMASYTALLEKRYKDKLDSDANDFINFIVDGAKRMQQLIDDLLAFCRAGAISKPFKNTDMESVLKIVELNLRLAIKESKAKITWEPLPVIEADEVLMVQIFQNLIDNAVKFRGKEPPIIHISAKQEESEWIFWVKDNGKGIDPKYFDRIFLIFQCLNNRDQYPGTGIGLAIVKRIVESYGGRVWVESESQKGSTFYFTIPKKGNVIIKI
jgi:nitrogen-specific signal transduction histidine kinase